MGKGRLEAALGQQLERRIEGRARERREVLFVRFGPQVAFVSSAETGRTSIEMTEQLSEAEFSGSERAADLRERRVSIRLVVFAGLGRGSSGWDALHDRDRGPELEIAVGVETTVGEGQIPVVEASCVANAALDRSEISAGETQAGFGFLARSPGEQVHDTSDCTATRARRPRSSRHLDFFEDVEADRR